MRVVPANPRGPSLAIPDDNGHLRIRRGPSGGQPAVVIVLTEDEVKSLRRALQLFDVEEEARQCQSPF